MHRVSVHESRYLIGRVSVSESDLSRYIMVCLKHWSKPSTGYLGSGDTGARMAQMKVPEDLDEVDLSLKGMRDFNLELAHQLGLDASEAVDPTVQMLPESEWPNAQSREQWIGEKMVWPAGKGWKMGRLRTEPEKISAFMRSEGRADLAEIFEKNRGSNTIYQAAAWSGGIIFGAGLIVGGALALSEELQSWGGGTHFSGDGLNAWAVVEVGSLSLALVGILGTRITDSAAEAAEEFNRWEIERMEGRGERE